MKIETVCVTYARPVKQSDIEAANSLVLVREVCRSSNTLKAQPLAEY